MHRVTVVILQAYLALALAKDLNDNEQNSVDNLLDMLVDRLISMPINHADLDQTTLAKGHSGTHGKTAALNLIQTLGAPSAMRGAYARPLPAASASPLAMSRPQFGGASMQEVTLFKGPTARGDVSANALRSYMQPCPAVPPPALNMGGTAMSVPAMQDALRKHGVRSSPFEKFALTALAATRDVSMAAQVKEVFSSMDRDAQNKVENLNKAVVARADTLNIEEMAGITKPMGFFDPLGKAKGADDATLYWYREVELAHCRWGMMASLGIVVTEFLNFHPFLGDNIKWTNALDGHYDPSRFGTFLESTQDYFWLALYLVVIIPEETKAFTKLGQPKDFSVLPGDIGWDPLGLRPSDPKKLLDLQNKELNNGRLAMLAAAGIIAQELVTGKPILPR
jgi:hypothetical protein